MGGVELWGIAGKSIRRRTGVYTRRFVFPKVGQTIERHVFNKKS